MELLSTDAGSFVDSYWNGVRTSMEPCQTPEKRRYMQHCARPIAWSTTACYTSFSYSVRIQTVRQRTGWKRAASCGTAEPKASLRCTGRPPSAIKIRLSCWSTQGLRLMTEMLMETH